MRIPAFILGCNYCDNTYDTIPSVSEYWKDVLEQAEFDGWEIHRWAEIEIVKCPNCITEDDNY